MDGNVSLHISRSSAGWSTWKGRQGHVAMHGYACFTGFGFNVRIFPSSTKSCW